MGHTVTLSTSIDVTNGSQLSFERLVWRTSGNGIVLDHSTFGSFYSEIHTTGTGTRCLTSGSGCYVEAFGSIFTNTNSNKATYWKLTGDEDTFYDCVLRGGSSGTVYVDTGYSLGVSFYKCEFYGALSGMTYSTYNCTVH